MPITAVIGVHWGDEGKGKVVDYLVDSGYDAVARYNGGPNSGHTIYDEQGRRIVLHVIPSGILHPHIKNIIGDGVALDPRLFLEEVATVRSLDRNLDNFYISEKCKVITPYHTAAEMVSPKAKKIGTTGKGMGLAYSSDTERISPRMAHFFGPRDLLIEMLEELDEERGISRRLIELGELPLNAEEIADSYRQMLGKIENNVCDTVYLVNKMLKDDKKIVAEGAQATLLSITQGTYPFVSSYDATVGGIVGGLGVPPKAITKSIGVMKAGYITRVGGGPFPTELGTEKTIKEEIKLEKHELVQLARKVRDQTASERGIGQYIREIGAEYGATTGRPRRTGWPDFVATSYSAMINGLDALALTKLDVSDFVPEIPVCTTYKRDDRLIERFDTLNLGMYRPHYHIRLPGWMARTTNARTFDDLPKNAQGLVEFWDKIARVEIISNGPRKEETIFR